MDHVRERGDCLATTHKQNKEETIMRKTFLTVLGVSLIAALAAQTADAAEHHRAHKADRASLSDQVRNSNAYAAPVFAEPDSSRYSGGFSAPAGR
jgi:hypothetical protein